MPKVKTTSPLYLHTGEKLTSPATFREAVANALGAADSKILSAYKQLTLAKKIMSADEVELDAEDEKTINVCCGAVFAPIIVGQVASIMMDGVSVFAPAE